MKKIIISLVLLLGIGLAANAQVKVSWDGLMGIDFKFKRCYVKGDRCVIDYTITNNSDKDVTAFSSLSWGATVYDDEGNMYEFQHGNEKIDNRESSLAGMDHFTGEIKIPREITVKAHIVIKDFDEFASKITIYKHNFMVIADGKYYNPVWAEFRNIPVTRD